MQNKDSFDHDPQTKAKSQRRGRHPIRSERAAEQKAAVMAALLAGQHNAQKIAEMHGVDKATVTRWKQELARELPELQKQAKTNFGEKLAECLASELEAIKARNRLFSDQSWLRDQDADALAVLHGISYDKVIRLIEAAQMANARAELEGCFRN
jgi:transposase-like protein